MKAIYLLLLMLASFIKLYAQENRIKYNPEKDDTDIAVFMNMMGFDYHKFELKSSKPAYVNVYINEYLNDELIKEFDHISANKNDTPKAYFDLVFTKIDSSKFTLKLYTLSKNDNIERIQFRIGELGLFKNLEVNKADFSYSWKLTDFTDNVGPVLDIGSRIPLLFYATSVEEVIDGKTVDAFCNVPNILNNKSLIENKGKIKHYFEIGLELVEKIE